MKKRISLVLALSFALAGVALAEKVHQKSEGEAAYAGDGGSALATKKIETKKVDGAEVARVTGATTQWGFVKYWLGIPTPAGHAVIRVRVLKTDEPTAKYALYIGDKGPLALTIPADAKNGDLVDIDIAVDIEKEWSGITLKKVSPDTLPGPWIDSFTVLVD
ncbi:MAG: hypothetical protein ACAI35_12985 [Candidatus Methylacidiphilales bacterium]|nr:hypothetical protein [Candidatus Methylacidiphilales bacterium]